jgi:TPR repeat protein
MKSALFISWGLAIAAIWLAEPRTALAQNPEKPPPVEGYALYKARWAAERGEAPAQFDLAFRHYFGFGVPIDATEAAKWCRKAAEQGHADAQQLLGTMYCEGSGVPQDIAEAEKWSRKAAEQGSALKQWTLGEMYRTGRNFRQSDSEAVKWLRKAAEQDLALAQYSLGSMYMEGRGDLKDDFEAVKWFRKAAEQGFADAQCSLGSMYLSGRGVLKDNAESVKWFRKAAEQGDAYGQRLLGVAFASGQGVPQNYVQAYSWTSLAAASGDEDARKARDAVAQRMSREQIAEAQKIAAAFRPKPWKAEDQDQNTVAVLQVDTTGSGFFVTSDGHFITNHHVVADAARIRVRTAAGTFPAAVIRSDPTNDIAILKVQGEFRALPVRGSRGLKLADRVATLGYPNPDLQGVASKYSSGEVAALSGPGDDPRFLQISVPIQSGNSGGPLVDTSGRVVGVVVSQLDKIATLKLTGNIPENVNYAIKGTILLGVMEAVPGLGDTLQSEPATPPKHAAEVAKLLEAACGMVLVEK